MACAAVPLAYRLLWGFLAREGGAEPKDLVFVEENGGEHNRHALARCARRKRFNCAGVT